MIGQRKMTSSEKRAIAKKREQNPGQIGFVEEIRENLPDDFEEMVAEYCELAITINELEKRKKEIAPFVESACLLAGRDIMMTEGYKIQRIVSRTAKRVLPERLVEKGVDWEIIEYATDPGKEYSYPMVYKLDKEGESR